MGRSKFIDDGRTPADQNEAIALTGAKGPTSVPNRPQTLTLDIGVIKMTIHPAAAVCGLETSVEGVDPARMALQGRDRSGHGHRARPPSDVG